MDEATWAACTDSFAMLNFLHESGWGNDPKMRPGSCALCRAVEHLLTDERYQKALGVAERYADGLAGAGELRKANGVVDEAIRHTDEYAWSEDKQGMLVAANAVSWATTLREPPDPPAYLAGCAALGAKSASSIEGLSDRVNHARQCALLRDILGSLPFRPVTVPPSVLGWDNGRVVKLAQAIYYERSIGDLPILADALEEAGCDDPDILTHCRAAGPHVRGCWVIDLLLEKE